MQLLSDTSKISSFILSAWFVSVELSWPFLVKTWKRFFFGGSNCHLLRLLRRHLGPTPNQDSNRILLSLLLVPSTGLVLLGNLTFADVAAAVQTFDRSSQDDLKEGDHQTGDQPDVDHLHVRGGGQLLNLAGEDGSHHQHDGQVHSNDITKQVFIKEDGGEDDGELHHHLL